MSAESRTIVYFQDCDTDDYIAQVNRLWLFRLRMPLTLNSRWEFQIPGSPSESFVSEKIFGGRAMPLTQKELPANLPLVPEIPPGPYPTRESYSMPKTPQPASDHPHLAARLARAQGTSEQVYVVLCEDRYETLFGDGQFHDFHAACFDQSTAEDVIAAEPNEWHGYYVIPLTVALIEDHFAFPGFTIGTFESYKLGDVLRALESHLKSDVLLK